MKDEANAIQHVLHPSSFILPCTPSLTVGLPPVSTEEQRDAHHESDGDDGEADEAATKPVREPRARIAARDCGEAHHENVRPVDLARRDEVCGGDAVDADGEKILDRIHLVYVREAE